MDTDGPAHAQLTGVYLVSTLPAMTYQTFRALNISFMGDQATMRAHYANDISLKSEQL